MVLRSLDQQQQSASPSPSPILSRNCGAEQSLEFTFFKVSFPVTYFGGTVLFRKLKMQDPIAISNPRCGWEHVSQKYWQLRFRISSLISWVVLPSIAEETGLREPDNRMKGILN